MESVTLPSLIERGVPTDSPIVLSTMVSPKDFLTVQMPAVIKNRAADQTMLRHLSQHGWEVVGVLNRTAYLQRPHNFKAPSGWRQLTAT